MPSNQLHYLPLTPAFFSLLVGVLVVVVVLIQLGILRYAYTRIGVGAPAGGSARALGGTQGRLVPGGRATGAGRTLGAGAAATGGAMTRTGTAGVSTMGACKTLGTGRSPGSGIG